MDVAAAGTADRSRFDHGARPGVTRWARNGLLRAVGLSAAISALSLRSFVHTGYVLQVDAVFGPLAPRLRWNFGLPVTTVQWVLTHLVGGAGAGRALFLAALFLSAFGPMLLLADRPWPVQCLAGLLGALNPWTAERLSEGQFGVVAAAGCLFLVVAAWESLQRRPGPRPAVLLAVAGAAAVACNAAFLGIVVVLVICAFVSARGWSQPASRRWAGVAGCLYIALLLYGIIPFLMGGGADTASGLGQVNRGQLTFFSASRGRYGLLTNLIGLYGSWAERLGRFQLPNHGAPWWPVTSAVLVGLTLLGAWRRRDRAWLLVSGAIGIAVSASTATAAGLSSVSWMIAQVHLLGLYREPEKWSALWLVALAVLAGEGTAPSTRRLTADQLGATRPAGGGTIGLLMAAAILFPAGLAQVHDLSPQLRPVTYPGDWTRAAAYLRAHVPAGERVLVLPWHLYESLDFAGSRLVANPARDIFPGQLVYPDDPEIPGQPVPPSSGGGLGRLARARDDSSCLLAQALRARHVNWVVVERAPGGVYDVDRLLSCGFHTVEASGGPTVVLQAPG